jgi:hypothetical protein
MIATFPTMAKMNSTTTTCYHQQKRITSCRRSNGKMKLYDVGVEDELE